MNEPVTIALIAALPGIAAASVAYFSAVKAAKTASVNETLKVEAGAFERARASYEAGMQQLEEQVARLRSQVAEERNISSDLRVQVDELEKTVARMRVKMAHAGLLDLAEEVDITSDLPPHPD